MIGLTHLNCDPSVWQCQCSAEVLLLRVFLERAWSNGRPKRNPPLNSLMTERHLRTVPAPPNGTEFPQADVSAPGDHSIPIVRPVVWRFSPIHF